MPRFFACSYLGTEVELTDEREAHILLEHSELLPHRLDAMEQTIADPDSVRLSARFANGRLFTRWYDDLVGGKYTVVVVIRDNRPHRNWIITADVTDKLRGEIEWARS